MYFGAHKRDGRALANFMRDGDHVVAHSNGGLVWQESIKAGAKWGKCFIFGAAATSDKMNYPDDCLESAYIIYNVKDTALRAGAKLPFHPFGKLGLVGFAGSPDRAKDKRFTNIRGFHQELGNLDHSHYFKDECPKWLKFITDKM